jgi:cyclophilin family peptidyl-prolyl cis-trans isomerase/HEAT repeat protein
MIKNILFILISSLLWFACNKGKADWGSVQPQSIFADATIRHIIDLQDQRQTDSVAKYLQSPEANYRQRAAMAFGILTDSAALPKLIELLYDSSAEVQQAAAFAISHNATPAYENSLIDASMKANNPTVKTQLFEAIGKIGSKKSMEYLYKLSINSQWAKQEIATAIYQFSYRKIDNDTLFQLTYNILADTSSNTITQQLASQYFSRNSQTKPQYSQQYFALLAKQTDEIVRMNMLRSISLYSDPNTSPSLDNYLEHESPRVTISLLRGLNTKHCLANLAGISKLLTTTDANLRIAASEALLRNAAQLPPAQLLQLATQQDNWRSRTNLLQAALRAAPQQSQIAARIVRAYEQTNKLYERAALLRALGEDIASYRYIAKEVFSTKEAVVATYGMEALVAIRQSDKFDYYNDKLKDKGQTDLYQEFKHILKEAISSNQSPLVAMAAELLRNPRYEYRNAYDNTYFLTQALHRLEIPKEIETYNELNRTINYFNGKPDTDTTLEYQHPINWELLQRVAPNQRVSIQTTKGKIELQLHTNDAPATVANFVSLVQDGYYNHNTIHRVEPNYVVQLGCPRGDGWGSPNFNIRTENSYLKFQTGSVGMASAGTDTESSQWFITHSPTPQLNGRYTNFAQVTSGMDVVQKLEIGDQILKIDILLAEPTQ